MLLINKNVITLLVSGLSIASSIKVKLYSRVSGSAKFTARCVDGSQPVLGDLNYVLADASVSTIENTEVWRSGSDCSDCGWGLCGCENCQTRCGRNPSFGATHQPICTDDDAAVLCTGSSCRGGLRAIGTAACANGAMELQVESSKLIVNTPRDVWVWASVKASDDIIDVRDISGYVLSSGKEFEVGGGALVIGRESDRKVGKCSSEKGVVLYGNPPEEEKSQESGDETPDEGREQLEQSGGAIAVFMWSTMLLIIGSVMAL